MSHYKQKDSISDLMSVAELNLLPARWYTTLPVVILALHVFTGTAILLVTDFTSHPDLGFAKGNLPKHFPNDFVIGTKRVERSQILAVSVPLNKAPQVWQSFGCPDLQSGGYDMEDEERCDILGLCIIMKLNFRMQAYKDGLEGYFANIYAWDQKIVGANISHKELEGRIFLAFMKRLASRMHPDLYNQLSRRMPLEKYIPRAETTQNVPEVDHTANLSVSTVERLVPMQTQTVSGAPKKRRLDPREAIYQQQCTQDTQNNASAPSSNMLLLGDAQRSVVLEKIVRNNRFRGGSSAPTGKPKVWNLRNSVEFEILYNIQCHEVPTRTTFETTASVADMDPFPEFVFVKPFGRTLKISPIRILLTKSQKYIRVEASVEEDLCRFFGIAEVEVAIHHVEDFVAALKSLPGKVLQISVEKRTRVLASGHEFPYWGISSSLESLLDQIADEG